MNTKDKGDIAEAHVVARLKELGYPVLTPFGDNQKYDLVYDNSGDFVRVQVKYSSVNNGRITVRALTKGHNTTDGIYEKGYTSDDVDEFIVYSPDTGESYKIGIDELPDTEMTLQIETPETIYKTMNFAENYKL